MKATRSTTEAALRPAPPALRLCGVTSDGLTTIATVGPNRTDVVLPGAPDPRLAAVATSGLRRVLHVLIEVSGSGVTCTLAGLTRSPVRRRVPLDVALALADAGTPTYVAIVAGS